MLTTPFNTDERAAQILSGYGELIGAPIRAEMPEQHRTFFAGLQYLFVGALEEAGGPLATILTGSPGFVRSPDPETLVVHALPAANDPTTPGIAIGSDIALLGIDLANRRRNRANGTVVAKNEASFTVHVEQSFGNCPKYIQRRNVEVATRIPGQLEESNGLDEAARALIRRADTFFIASRSRPEVQEAARVDVSHRGGLPGFVTIDSDDRLIVPDYRGNRFFNTLGNLLGDPRATLLFIDFEQGDLLQLQGLVTIDWSRENSGASRIVERAWHFEVRRSWRRPAAIPLQWQFIDYSTALLRDQDR
jgi:predicted pyridoxine 5'-phosphate oxidase superfamily flavin-nucleotide-binding protein